MTVSLPGSLKENLPNSLMVCVGDLSADRHAAKIVAELKSVSPGLRIWGLGSDQMAQAGAEILFNCKDFSSIGIIGVIKLIPFLSSVRKRLLTEIESRKPKAVLLVDYSGFNLILAKAIKKSYPSLPILYFISPQVWGSRPWRMNTIAQTINKMLVIFPFEEQLYSTRGIPAKFVGHPLTRNLPSVEQRMTKAQFCTNNGLNEKQPIIAVFPGSRKSEIKTLVPVICDSIIWLHKERPHLQFVISQTNEDLGQEIETKLKHSFKSEQMENVVRFIPAASNYDVMSACDIVWAKSGTTTLETTLFGKPMLIFYRADWVSYLIFLAFKRTQRVGWPNLLAGKELVPELIQLDCRAEQLVKYSKDLLDVPGLHHEISQELLALRDQLGSGDYVKDCSFEIAKAMQNSGLLLQS